MPKNIRPIMDSAPVSYTHLDVYKRQVLHMGSCVDISRMMILAAELAKDSGLQINQLPVVGCAPEWMSEKAVSIGNYVVGTGIDTFLGVDPYVSGSSEMCELLTEGTRKWTGAAYTVETDIEKLTDLMIERIEEKRTAPVSYTHLSDPWK